MAKNMVSYSGPMIDGDSRPRTVMQNISGDELGKWVRKNGWIWKNIGINSTLGWIGNEPWLQTENMMGGMG